MLIKALKTRRKKFFIEVRCVKDELFGKGTLVAKNTYFYNGHNRRFIEKEELAQQLTETGFQVIYAEEKPDLHHLGIRTRLYSVWLR